MADFMIGKRCDYRDERADPGSSGNYKRCREYRDIEIRKHSYITDTLCEIKGITMAPDKTFLIVADCKAEGSNRTVSREWASVHLAGDVLRWNFHEEEMK
jgi:hypothetical protein